MALVLVLVCGILPRSSRPATETVPGRNRPSILLISIDTLRADHLGLYGYSRPTDPALSLVARRFAVFEQAYSPIPLTLPAHSSMMTGREPLALGVLNNHSRLPSTEAGGPPTLAALLAAAGYRTAAVVASAVVEGSTGLSRGFGTYDDPSHSRDPLKGTADRVNVLAARQLERPDPPLFLFVHYYDPHEPYDVPDRVGCLFRPDEALKRHLQERHLLSVPYQSVLNRTHDMPLSERGRPVTLEEMMNRYDASVRAATDRAAELIDLWDATRHGPGSLVIVTSDHGEGLGEHGFWSHGMNLYDEALRVPLLVRWPGGLNAGRRLADTVSLLDLVPTVLEAAGVPAPADLPGHPLGDRSEAAAAAHPLVAQRMRYRTASPSPDLRNWRRGDGYAVLDGTWKYVEETDSPPMLFDRREDPRELDSLAGRGHPAEERLRRALSDWKAGLRSVSLSPAPWSEDPERARRLRSLGYAVP